MIRADFTNTEDFALADEGVQYMKIEKVYEKSISGGQNAGKPMVVFELRAKNGGKVFHNCMNFDGCRWMLKKTLHAITGQKPAKGVVEFEPEELIDEEIRVNIFHDEFNGRISAKVRDVLLPGDKASDPDPDNLEGDEF